MNINLKFFVSKVSAALTKTVCLTLLLAPLVLTGKAEAASSEKAPETLRIGYQKSAVNLVLLKQQGKLEKRFPTIRITWSEFPAGPQLLEALSVGSLDFGMTGDTPPVFAQAAGKSLVYVGAENPKPEASAILVLQSSPLQTLADLKGRKVAIQKGSSAHYLLVRALEKSGLSWKDIQPIYLTPADARAAFERGSVDAWAIWDPFYASAEASLATRVLSSGVGLTNNNSFYLASPGFAKQYPQIVSALFDELTQADLFASTHRAEAAKIYADASGLDPSVVNIVLRRRPHAPVKELTVDVLNDQQHVADAFSKLGLFPNPIKVSDIVWHLPH